MITVRVQIPDKTEPCTIEAPSPGVAIEYFLAIHGIMTYDDITVQETDEMPEETIEKVSHLIPGCQTPKVAETYDEWHTWRTIE